MTCELKFILNC